MPKLKEILRLYHEGGMSRRAIAASLDISRSTVTNVLARAETTGVGWPLPSELEDESKLESTLYPAVTGRPRKIEVPDWNYVHQELRRKGVTLQLLWIEYKQEHQDGYQYSQFCEHYHQWKKRLDISMHQQHRGGEKMFVDYAGQTVSIIDPDTGEVREAEIFVAVLGASNYTYAEGQWSQSLGDFIGGHVNAFQYFGGVPELIVPDNLKSAVKKSDRYEPSTNRTYAEMVRHYGCAVMPARPYRPKDKPKVEVGVKIIEQWILAALRNRRFFSLGELNTAIHDALETLNNKPFQKLEGTRASLFAAVDKPALRALPAIPYEFARWVQARVAPDYHIEVDKNYYSVPYSLVREYVDVRISEKIVEVFLRGRRVTSHVRETHSKYRHITEPAHMPKSHLAHMEWTPEKFINWGKTFGPYTATVTEQILHRKAHPEQAYRSYLGLQALAKKFSRERIESACAHAVSINACTYRSVKSILEAGIDQVTLDLDTDKSMPIHENVRGAAYYSSSFSTGKPN